MLSSWGVCSSYSTLAGTQVSAKRKDKSSPDHEGTDLEIASGDTPALPATTSNHPEAMEVDDDAEDLDQSELESEGSVSSESELGASEIEDVPVSGLTDDNESNGNFSDSDRMDVDSPIERVSIRHWLFASNYSLIVFSTGRPELRTYGRLRRILWKVRSQLKCTNRT